MLEIYLKTYILPVEGPEGLGFPLGHVDGASVLGMVFVLAGVFPLVLPVVAVDLSLVGHVKGVLVEDVHGSLVSGGDSVLNILVLNGHHVGVVGSAVEGVAHGVVEVGVEEVALGSNGGHGQTELKNKSNYMCVSSMIPSAKPTA